MHWFNSAVPEEKKSANLAGLGKKLFGFYEIISIILIILSLIGIGITDYSPASSHIYWLVMVPVFAAACLIIEWEHMRGKGQQWLSILRTQIMLWVGLLLAVQMVYLLLHAGRLDYENTGLIILLLLALTTFSVGVNLDWRLMVVGIYLGLVVIGAAYLETFFWLFFLIAIAVIAAFLLLRRFVTD
jgi:hypothetical protein